ncbi:MAG: MarR family winged helix-turn-helix transcriptional regulator [Lautropia sp.]
MTTISAPRATGAPGPTTKVTTGVPTRVPIDAPAAGAAAGPDTPRDVTGLLGFKLLRLSNTMGQAAERRYIARIGLSLPEWRCLSIISNRGPLAAADVVLAIRTDKAWVSRTIDRLAARELVRIRPDRTDRRRTLVSATARGRALNDRVFAAATERHAWLLDALPPGERAVFLDALDALQARADALPDSP